MEDDDYAIPFNSVMSKEQVDGSYKLFTMSYSDVYKEKGFTMARMDDGSYNIALKEQKHLVLISRTLMISLIRQKPQQDIHLRKKITMR